jgi:ABC-type phosphate transport system auxiliary subunit
MVPRIISQSVQRRVRPNSTSSDPRFEHQYQIGLRELNSTSYIWVDEINIVEEKFDNKILGFERMENGPAFIIPKVIIDSSGKKIVADENSLAVIQSEVDHATEIREKVLDINQNKIGRVNAEWEATRIADVVGRQTRANYFSY